MQEIRRIFFKKRFIVTFFLMLVFHGWYVWNEQRPDKETREEYAQFLGDFEKEEQKFYHALLEEYKDRDFQEVYEELHDYYEEKEKKEQELFIQGILEEETDEMTLKDIEEIAREKVYSQILYLKDYEDYVTGIQVSANEMKKNSVFAEMGSFSLKNINKTVADFENVRQVRLSLENEDAVSAYLNYNIGNYLMVIFLAMLVTVLLEERKKGLWMFVYATENGRCSLAGYRVVAVAMAAVLGTLLLELENIFLIGLYHGGFGDLSRAAQSNPDFKGCVLSLSMGMFLVLSVCLKILLAFCCGLLLWLIASLQNTMVAFGFLVGFLGLEAYAYTNIGVQSTINALKYLNIFAFFDSGHILITYRNVNVFGMPLHPGEVLLRGIPIVLLMLVCGIVISAKRYPFVVRQGIWERIQEQCLFFFKPYRHGKLFFHEAYKVFALQKGGWILLLLLLYLFSPKKTTEIFYDYSTTLYHQYMEMLSGEVTEEKVNYLWSEQELWKKKITQTKETLEDETSEYRNMEMEEKKLTQYQIANAVVEELIHQSNRFINEKEQGKNVGFVDKTGYDMYFGTSSQKKAMQDAFLVLILLVLMLFSVLSFEKMNHSEQLLKSTQNGRNVLFRKKCIICILTSLLVSGIVMYRSFSFVCRTYGLKNLKYSVFSLDLFSDVWVDIPLWGMVVLLWICRIMAACSVSFIILWMSGRTKTLIESLVLNAAILIVPAGLVMMGFSKISVVSVLRPMMVTAHWNQYGFGNIVSILPLCVLVGIGILCLRLAKKKSV